MSTDTRKSKVGGLLTALLELALSFGGYYLLRAFGVNVFWALTVPAIAVAAVTVVTTVRRGRIDLVGLLVLAELGVTIVLSLLTRSPRVAASREPFYILVGGLFCLVTLVHRRPFTHLSTSSIANFGDPKRERAFELAWQDVPEYRMWQRLLTAFFGVVMVGAAVIRIWLVFSAPAAGIAHTVDVSNAIGLVMIGVLLVGSTLLIQRPRKIVEKLVSRMD